MLLRNRKHSESGGRDADVVAVVLDGLQILMRKVAEGKPYETTVIIPHAEVEIEKRPFHTKARMVLDSITVVHSPRCI